MKAKELNGGEKRRKTQVFEEDGESKVNGEKRRSTMGIVIR